MNWLPVKRCKLFRISLWDTSSCQEWRWKALHPSFSGKSLTICTSFFLHFLSPTHLAGPNQYPSSAQLLERTQPFPGQAEPPKLLWITIPRASTWLMQLLTPNIIVVFSSANLWNYANIVINLLERVQWTLRSTMQMKLKKKKKSNDPVPSFTSFIFPKINHKVRCGFSQRSY